jgi:osmotically inducible protein OsmC
MKREASARWNGGFKDGSGVMSTSSGAVKDLKYSAGTRFENNPGTNPEELIAAAHAGCFSMAFSVQLGNAGITPERIETRASANFEKIEAGWTVTTIHLAVSVKATGADAAAVKTAAENAKKGCPVSRLLKAEITMDVTIN